MCQDDQTVSITGVAGVKVLKSLAHNWKPTESSPWQQDAAG